MKYQDTEGNQLADPTILSGKVGMPYASEAREIPGWHVVESPSNASGTFSEEAQEVVYVYDVQKDNGKKSNIDKESPGIGKTETGKKNTLASHLPNTSERVAGQKLMMGLGILLVLLLVAIGRRKKNKESK